MFALTELSPSFSEGTFIYQIDISNNPEVGEVQCRDK